MCKCVHASCIVFVLILRRVLLIGSLVRKKNYSLSLVKLRLEKRANHSVKKKRFWSIFVHVFHKVFCHYLLSVIASEKENAPGIVALVHNLQ